MKTYIATDNKVVSCIYGTFKLKKGEAVLECVARKFPHFVTLIETDNPIVEETKEPTKKGKKQ